MKSCILITWMIQRTSNIFAFPRSKVMILYYKKSISLFWENLISLLLPINYFVDSGQFLEKAYKRQYSHSGSYH